MLKHVETNASKVLWVHVASIKWVGLGSDYRIWKTYSLELSSTLFIEKVLDDLRWTKITCQHLSSSFMHLLVSTCMLSLSLPASASVWISPAPPCPPLPHTTMKLNTEEPWRTLFPVKDIGTCWNWCFNSIMSSSGFYKMGWVGFLTTAVGTMFTWTVLNSFYRGS